MHTDSGLTLLIESQKTSLFGDKRLDKRGIKLVKAMEEKQSLVIQQLGENNTERIGYYRFMANPKVKESQFAEALREKCRSQVKEGHILAISDTTEVSLSKQAGRITKGELGVISDHKSLGFLLHACLLIDAEQGEALGISSAQSRVRPFDLPTRHERKYGQLPIEEKESYKWLQTIEDTEACLNDNVTVTYIADREADIYDKFDKVKETNANLVVRARGNRSLYDSEEKLFDALSQQEILGSYTITLEADHHRNNKRKQRDATLEICSLQVKLKRPKRSSKDLPEYIELYALEIKEINAPEGCEPILWRLLTTHDVSNVEKARQVIQWYSWRWFIEELFRTLKKQGLDLEGTNLGDMDAIRKLSILALELALKVMQLTRARHGSQLDIQTVFSQEEKCCLEQLAPRFEGKTTKQQNPYPPNSLAWGAWIIARLGGWTGYSSQRPPGVITFYRGLKKFESIFLGWSLIDT